MNIASLKKNIIYSRKYECNLRTCSYIYIYYIVKMTVRDKHTLKITYLNRYYLNLKTLTIQSGISDVKERENMRRSIYMYI